MYLNCKHFSSCVYMHLKKMLEENIIYKCTSHSSNIKACKYNAIQR